MHSVQGKLRKKEIFKDLGEKKEKPDKSLPKREF